MRGSFCSLAQRVDFDRRFSTGAIFRAPETQYHLWAGGTGIWEARMGDPASGPLADDAGRSGTATAVELAPMAKHGGRTAADLEPYLRDEGGGIGANQPAPGRAPQAG